MAKIALILLFVTFVSSGYALQCYNCRTDNANDRNCAENKNIASVACGAVAGGGKFKAYCLKKVIKDKTTQVINTTRSCGVYENTEADSDCKNIPMNSELVFCEACADDLCNSSTTSVVNIFTFLGLIASLFLTKIFLH